MVNHAVAPAARDLLAVIEAARGAFSAAGADVLDVDGIGRRTALGLGDHAVARVDDFGPAGLCIFLRASGLPRTSWLELPGRFAVTAPAAGGWLASPIDVDAHAYWCPVLPRSRRLGPHDYILADRDAEIAGVSVEPGCIRIGAQPQSGDVLDWVIWQLPANAGEELRSPLTLERQRYFLWGSHTSWARPSDVYRHVVFGSVYEDRFSWPHKRRICSENDAHALHVVLTGLRRATGKDVHDLVRRQIVLSVLARQDADGGFRHGEWTGRHEAHFRLHCSAMHLMMDVLSEVQSNAVAQRLKRAAAFLQTARSPLDPGTWFIHDELEQSDAAMAEAPFAWLRTRSFGKTTSNMLVINTHMDATIALERYARVTGDRQYASIVEAAARATRHMLSLRPAEWLYRLAFWPISLTLLPQREQARLPGWKRVAKRIGWRYLAPNLHRLKSRFPRFVMPGGYVDRAIPLGTWAFHYLTVNLMDLVRHARRMPSPEIDEAIRGALAFTHGSGVLDRWAELAYERYALGFWAEALIQYCSDHPDSGLESWLADAVLRLHDLGMGLPPSALGANAEMADPSGVLAWPLTDDPGVRVLALGRPPCVRFMIVNCGTQDAGRGLLAPDAVDETPLAARGWKMVPALAIAQHAANPKNQIPS